LCLTDPAKQRIFEVTVRDIAQREKIRHHFRTG